MPLLPTAIIPSEISPVMSDLSAFTTQFKYILGRDRKIYIKPHNPLWRKTIKGGDIVDSPTSDWQLFDGTGLPHAHGRELLKEDEYLSVIKVECEVILVSTNRGRIFLYKPTAPQRPTDWCHNLGMVFAAGMVVPLDSRDIALSVGIGDRLNKKTTQIHPRDRVRACNDGNGIPQECGVVITWYTLDRLGRIIFVTDTGLKPALDIAVLMPLDEDGDEIQGLKIDAAGSILFAVGLDKHNRLRYFTSEAVDYEILAAPGMTYSLSATHPGTELVNGMALLGHGTRRYVDQLWHEQNTHSLPPSNIISIHAVGPNNTDRELRIEIATGFYFKMINERSWKFYPTSTPQISREISSSYIRGLVPLLKNYEGIDLKYETKRGTAIQIQLLRFHHYKTLTEPSFVRISDGILSFDIKFHVVDGWGVSYLKRGSHDLIGSKFGKAKTLLGSIVLTDMQLLFIATNPEHPLAVYMKTLLPYHLQTKVFVILADDQNVKIKSKDHKIKLIFTRQLSRLEIEESFYMRQALQPALNAEIQDLEHCRLMLEHNRKILADIKQVYNSNFRRNIGFFIIDHVASAITTVIKPFCQLYFAGQDRPYALPRRSMGKKALEDVKPLFLSDAEACFDALLSERSGFNDAKRIVATNIARCEDYQKIVRRARVL